MPEIVSPRDCSHFDEFDEVEPWISYSDHNSSKLDFEFIGFTFKADHEN